MRLTRAKAAAQIHVDQDVGESTSASSTPTKDLNGPLGEVSPNSIKGESTVQLAGTPEPQGKPSTPTVAEKSEDMYNTTPGLASRQAGPLASTPILEQTNQHSLDDSSNIAVQRDATPETPHGPFSVSESLSVPKNTQARNMLSKQKVGMRSTSNKENMQPFSPAVQSVGSPQANVVLNGSISGAATASPTRTGLGDNMTLSPPRVAMPKPAGDPIEAMDALEEALEEVSIAMPRIDTIASPQKEYTKEDLERLSVLAPPAVKSGLGGSTQSGKVSRSGSVRKSVTARPNAAVTGGLRRNAPVRSTFARSSIVRQASASSANVDDSDLHAPKPEVEIPHSKPRPMSMSFPTPPPPAKSSKPQTRPTFQLPGEVVAAKLKAAREERLKKEEDEQAKRPQFKARPAPNKKENVAPVRQTAASRGRESLMLGKDGIDVKTGTSVGLGRSSNARDSMSKPRGPSSTAAKRLSVVPRTTFASSIMGSSASRASNMGVSKRASLATANTFKVRVSSAGVPGAPRTASGSTTSATSKGKEVFQRAAIEKEMLEQKKKEKEDAAKKARAEAAERSRLLSREWAEKQKARKAAAKKEASATAVVV